MTAVLERPATAVSPRAAWRRLFARCLLVPLVVTAPLVSLVAGADHRYNVYWHGSIVQDRPWHLVTENLRSVPMYLDFGNFRPLGRMMEWAIDFAAYLFGEITHLPVHVGLRVMSALAAAVLVAAAVLFAEAVTARGRMFAEPPARTIALLPFAIGGCLCAAGQSSSTVLFGGLYFGTAALVLAVAAWVSRGPRLGVLVVVAGAALAAFNEMAALAPPLATVALLARGRLVLGAWPRLRPAFLLWLGFLPVFLPVRILLYAACRDGDCYQNSDLLLGPGALTALPNRLTAWLPPLQWGEALRNAEPVSRVVLIAAVAGCALLAVRLFAELPRLPRLDRGQATGLAAGGAALLLLGAVLGSVNGQGQEAAALGRWGLGWRDSGLTAAGGGLVLAGLLALAIQPAVARPTVARPVVARAALAAFALAAAGTTTANQAFALTGNRLPYAVLSSQIAAEVAQFDRSAAGQARRCELLDRFDGIFRETPYSRFASGELPGTHSATERMAVTASMATEQMYGRPFCR